jgi:hypothetical protein
VLASMSSFAKDISRRASRIATEMRQFEET